MAFLVSYDLRKPNQDYSILYDELKKSSGWWHYLESTWLIDTRENATQLYNRLVKTIDKNDSILIIEVGTDRQGWLPADAWKWMKEHIDKIEPNI